MGIVVVGFGAIDSRVGGDPGKERVIYLAIMGKSGQALWDYYRRVGEETKQWPPMRALTTDIIICDNARVRRRRCLRFGRRD